MQIASQVPNGRLELTWTNKALRLLAHDDGSYEWTDPGDHRVAEVRLLHGAGEVGNPSGNAFEAPADTLIRGDALHALRSLSKLPEFACDYLGKVRLAYIDPPFNTGQAFDHYDDALEHSVWLTMMRDRLMQIRDLLNPESGSVWVHLDDAEMAYCRVVMDEIFGRSNFIACVVWEKTYTPKSNGRGLSTDHDYILVYARNSSEWLKSHWNFLARNSEQEGRFQNPDQDPKGPWRTYPLDVRTENSGRREAYRYAVTTPSGRSVNPSAGRHWVLPQQRFVEEAAMGRIYFGKNGEASPTRKVYLSEARDGVIGRTWWPYSEVGGSQTAKKHAKVLLPDVEPFATPKPEELLERVLQIASDPGDIVLDCFLGSGTTAAVATKMGRRWVGIEVSAQTLESHTIPRLRAVCEGDDRGGISQSQDWTGGGRFRVFDIAASMFDVDGGRVVLAPWASGGSLAAAVCAQGSWEYVDDPPFCGRRARARLAVIDGLVTADVALMLAAWLENGEKLVVYGTAVDPEARQALGLAFRGSTVKQVPQSLLADYRREWRREAHDWLSLLTAETDTPAQDLTA